MPLRRERSTQYPVRRMLALAMVALGLGLPSAARGQPFQGELEAVLGGHWIMRLTRGEDGWAPVRRSRPNFRNVDVGFVVKEEGDAERMTLEVHLRRDMNRGEAFVFYELDLRRDSDGTYAGTWRGSERGETSEGELTATVRPVVRAGPASEIAPGEHPRLLLRRDEVPALRERFQTPFGQAFAARARTSRDPVVLGLLYQASGDPAYAERAMEIVGGYSDIDATGRLTGEMGHQIVRVVLAYDLCHDAWPEAFRTGLRQNILSRLPKRQNDLIIGSPNYSPSSNFYGPGFGSAAIATLALARDPGPRPAEPVPPLIVRRADGTIPPEAGFGAPPGVPVIPFQDDVKPHDWIYTGGFRPVGGHEPMDAHGGLARARPALGDQVTDGTRSERFRPVSREPDQGYWEWGGRPVLDITSAIGRVYHSVSYFYTVIRNDAPRWVELRMGPDHEEHEVYLAGQRMVEGHGCRLEPGLYPMLIRVRIGQTEPWGREMMSPRLAEITEERAREASARLRLLHEDAMRYWRTAVAEWERRGGEDLDILARVEKGREQMTWHYRKGIGDGGFQAEVGVYGLIASFYPLTYAAFHRNVFGREASPDPDAGHVLPRLMMQADWSQGRPRAMPLNTQTNFGAQRWAVFYPLVPEPWRPAVLWGWNRILGAPDSPAGGLDRAAADRIFREGDGLQLAATFVNYPLDLDPAPPEGVLPRTWQAETFGLHVFRSGWEADATIAQVFLKARPIGGWSHPNAGAFRLWGLGRPWTAAPIERSGYRPEESIVLLPDEVTAESACARLTRFVAEPDGSGALSLDMNDVYITAPIPESERLTEEQKIERDLEDILSLDPRGGDLGLDDAIRSMPQGRDVQDFFRERDRGAQRRRIPRLYDRMGERRTDVDRSSRVTGSRAFAFDYSGASGAPALMVLADTLRGGGRKQWMWHLPHQKDYRVRLDGQSFTVTYPDAVMRVTLVTSSPVTLRWMENTPMTFIYRGGSRRGDMETRTYQFIAAETPEKDVDIVAVVTLQRRDPPAVEVSGEGENAVITVGSQTIRYRDGHILLGEPPSPLAVADAP